MKEEQQRISIKKQMDNNNKSNKNNYRETKQGENTETSLYFNDSGFFSSLCSLYSLPLSPSSALSGPPCLYRYIPESAPAAGGSLVGFPLGKEQRGRVREGEKDYQLRGVPPPSFPPFFDFSRPGMVKNHSV